MTHLAQNPSAVGARGAAAGAGALAVLLTLLAGAGAAAGKPAAGAAPGTGALPPTCAVLFDHDEADDGEWAAAAALLEARLAEPAEPAAASVRLLDRSAIDAVLKEQQVAALFGAEAGGRRSEVGRLLKADLLVVLRRAPAQPAPAKPAARGAAPPRAAPAGIELVVCETGRGLRLRIARVPASDDPASQAAELAAAVREAVARFAAAAGSVREVCAVPPFVSNDLAYEFDHLRGAYAALAGEAMAAAPGVLLVALDEARAIAREVALGGGDVRRPLPLYLMGQYRHAGLGDARRVRVELSLSRGERTLKSAAVTLPPDEAPAYVRETAARWSGELAGTGDVAPAAPDVEARQLAERAAQLRRLGQWDDAVTLIEASLLLRPGRRDLHGSAALALAKLAEAQYDPYGDEANFARKARVGLAFGRRATEHAEAALTAAPVPADHNEYNWQLAVARSGGAYDFIDQYARHHNVAEIRKLCDEANEARREAYRRIVEAHAARGRCDMLTQELMVSYAVRHGGPPSYDRRLWAIRLLLAAGGAAAQPGGTIRRVGGHGLYPAELASEGYRAFLADVERLGGEDAARAAAALRRDADAELAMRDPGRRPKRPSAPTEKSEPPPAGTVSLTPHKLKVIDPDGKPQAAPYRLSGWTRTVEGVDATWELKKLYLMKEKGVLTRVFHTEERFFNFHGVVYDGRYLWAPVIRPEPLVLVVDPASGRVWHITAADGLPPTQRWVAAAPAGKGRVCLVGSFGRTWCAIATFDPERGGATVKVVHEARKAVNPEEDPDAQARDPEVAFHPSYVYAVDGRPAGGGPEHRLVVIGRSNALSETHRHPLLLDPSDGSVRLAAGPIGESDAVDYYFTPHEGAIYWLAPDRKPGTYVLRRFGFPTLVTETLAEGLPAHGRVGLDDEGHVHIAGQRWWTADRAAGPYRPLAGDVPQSSLTRIVHSHHYGLLLLTNNEEDGGTPFEVEFGEGDWAVEPPPPPQQR